MKIFHIENMVGGWFIGDFVPSAVQTSQFEVGFKVHPKGEKWPAHYHKEATEINLLVKGKMFVQGTEITPGQIFVFEPGEVADPTFVETCEVVVVKMPSVRGDKYEV